MPLSKKDLFKAVFGIYQSSQYSEWLAITNKELQILKDNLALLKNKAPSVDTTDFDSDVTNYEARLASAIQNKNSGHPKRACKTLDSLKSSAKKKSKEVRNALRDGITPTDVPGLMATANGGELLDQMVADLGGKADSAAKKAFVAAALKERFDITSLTGDLTTKALPRLYKVMGSVPLSHTQNNPMLKAIERHRDSDDNCSWYIRADKKIVLNLNRTGPIRGALNMEPYEPSQNNRIKTRPVSAFDVTTLHEIGHAVDAKLNYMGGKMGNPNFGGWRTESTGSILQVAGQNKGFINRFKATHPVIYLQEVLREVFNRKDLNASNQYLVRIWTQQTQRANAARSITANTLSTDPGIVESEQRRVANGGAGFQNEISSSPRSLSRAKMANDIKGTPKDIFISKITERILKDGIVLNTAITQIHNSTDSPPMTQQELLVEASLVEAERLRAVKGGAYGNIWSLPMLIVVHKMVALQGEEGKIAKDIVKTILRDGTSAVKAINDMLLPYQNMTSVKTDPDFRNMIKHQAISFLKSVRLTGDNDGLWDKGNSGSDKAREGNKVYQESYKNNFVSYLHATRAQKVSNYQFRAPAEWFAELYAMYYLGKLGNSHPAYAWMSTDIDQ